MPEMVFDVTASSSDVVTGYSGEPYLFSNIFVPYIPYTKRKSYIIFIPLTQNESGYWMLYSYAHSVIHNTVFPKRILRRVIIVCNDSFQTSCKLFTFSVNCNFNFTRAYD